MWNLVISQLRKTHQSLITFDKDLAREVLSNETRVNSFELQIDLDCENIFALFHPVAVDLRFVLAILKINNNLERTGDIAEGIARFIISAEKPFDATLQEVSQVILMYEEAADMLVDVLKGFEQEDTKTARGIFKRDEILDEINGKANQVIANYLRNNPENIEQSLYLLSIIRKLERVGDQCKNIAEEIIFYVEAKVLKHKETSEKKD